ncbi:hypothetical protein HaLaN_16803, partial [Haematococcus lacustris]
MALSRLLIALVVALVAFTRPSAALTTDAQGAIGHAPAIWSKGHIGHAEVAAGVELRNALYNRSQNWASALKTWNCPT